MFVRVFRAIERQIKSTEYFYDSTKRLAGVHLGYLGHGLIKFYFRFVINLKLRVPHASFLQFCDMKGIKNNPGPF